MRPLRLLFVSSAPEKLLHQRAAFRLEHARSYFNPVIQKIRVANSEATYDRARPLIRCAINQTPDTRLYQSACAHRARFNRRVNINAGQTVIADLTGGFAKGNDFSVGCGIAVGTRSIAGNGDELVFADDTSADGHFAVCLGFSRSSQRLPHPSLVKIC